MHSIRLQVRTLLLSLFYLTVPAFVVAGEYNPELSPGDPAPAMASLEGTDGKSYSLESFQQAEVIVIAFTCNTCPYAIDYEKRLSQLAREYADDDRVAFLAINSNREPADSLEEMRKRVEEQKLPYPYVSDPSQQTAKDFGALRTPEFVVLDKQRNVAYLGAFDDSPAADKVEQRYLPEAVAALLAGDKVKIAETPPIGCLIRFKRTRGRR